MPDTHAAITTTTQIALPQAGSLSQSLSKAFENTGHSLTGYRGCGKTRASNREGWKTIPQRLKPVPIQSIYRHDYKSCPFKTRW